MRDFDSLILHPVAHIETDFPTKFAIPRQGTVASRLYGRIVFEKAYRKDGILRGIEGYSHLYLLWGFSEQKEDTWSPTIRPPKLGGNERVGVFASRSPNRPNPIGLSVVAIEAVEDTKEGPSIIVSGVDMMSGTPIYDIKPYLPFADSFPDAKSGYSKGFDEKRLHVVIPEDLATLIPDDKKDALIEILSQDPRPGYQKEKDRTYHFEFSFLHLDFKVEDETLTVTDITPLH